MSVLAHNFRMRRNFGKIQKIVDIPNLIDIQKRSYDKFLQIDVAARASARTSACRACSSSVFPIKDFNETTSLEFVELQPREAQVRRRRVPPARHDLRRADQGRRPPGGLGQRRGDRRAVDPRRQGAGGLLRRDPADDAATAPSSSTAPSGSSSASCTARRASSSTTTRARRHASGKLLYNARIIPYRGSWIDFEFDHGHPLRPHRPPPQAARDRAAARPRDHHRGAAQLLLREGHDPRRRQPDRQAGSSARPSSWHQAEPRRPRTGNEILVKEGRKLTKASIDQNEVRRE